MPLTDSLEEVSGAIKSILDTNANALGLEDVFYGEEELIPRTPAASVDPNEKVRDLRETGYTVINTFSVFIVVYHAKLQGSGVTRKETLALAEAVETLINADPTLNLGKVGEDRIVNGMCTSVQEGYAQRGKTIMKASRITWEGFSKTRLQPQGG